MADAAQIQQMLANLQGQITTVSNMAGQLSPSIVPLPSATPPTQQIPNLGNVDISLIVKNAVDAELQRRLAAPTIVTTPPAQALPYTAPEPAAAPVPAPVPVPQVAPTPIMLPSTSTEVSAPVAPPAPAPASPPSMQDLMMKDFLNKIKIAIGGGLTGDQQIWVSSNLFGLPDFLKSADGRQAISDILTKYKQYVDTPSA